MTELRRRTGTKIASMLVAVAALASLAACEVRRGPDPTAASAGAAGPFTYTRIEIPDSETPATFGGATIFYPNLDDGRRFSVIAGITGFQAERATMDIFASVAASHGFAVINVDTVNPSDGPSQRATALLDAVDYLTQDSEISHLTTASRVGLFGYSMGGGGALEAATRDHSIRGVVSFVPWHLTKAFSTPVPVAIVGAERDTTASPAEHAIPMYEQLTGGGQKAYIEIGGASHTMGGADVPTVLRTFVTWLKRYVDGDTRYEALRCPGPEVDGVKVSDLRSNCPVSG